MRKLILWCIAFAALAAPILAFRTRLRSEHHASDDLREGLAILDGPLAVRFAVESTDLARAAARFRSARNASPGSVEHRRARSLGHVVQAYADLARGELSLAQQEADTASSLDPTEPHAMLASATVAFRRADRRRAQQLLERIALLPASAPSTTLRARADVLRTEILLDAGRTHDALAIIESVDAAHPRVAVVKNLLGLARAGIGDANGARNAWTDGTRLDPSLDAPFVNLARMARESGDLAGARRLLQRALEGSPESADAWLALGIVLGELGDTTARHSLVRAASLAPDDAAALVAQGALDMGEQNFRGAIESYRRALQREPENATALTNLGIALVRGGDREAALEAFVQATRRAPHMGQAWNGLGALRLQSGDAERAIGPLQQASALLADDPNPALNLGLAFEAMQRWNDAGRAFREALRRSPGQPVATEHLLRLTPAALRPREARRAGLTARTPNRS